MEENYRRLKEINKKLRREIRQRMGGDLNVLNINELQALEAKMDSSLLAILERKEDDGSDSLSVQLVDEKHWEDLFIVIAVSKECLEKVTQTIYFLAQPRESHLLLLTGIELQSFWVCVHAIFGHDTQVNLEMSFGCSQTMTLGRD
ncbi:hypothetical protein ERO13_D13G078500v2 [Gossypium hirsutum]|nr:hypothetical protein ERO13_D13G078500v2 [Gossypium hirsutum]